MRAGDAATRALLQGLGYSAERPLPAGNAGQAYLCALAHVYTADAHKARAPSTYEKHMPQWRKFVAWCGSFLER